MDFSTASINHVKMIILTLVAIVIGKKILKFFVKNYDLIVIGAFFLYFLNDKWKQILDEAIDKHWMENTEVNE